MKRLFPILALLLILPTRADSQIVALENPAGVSNKCVISTGITTLKIRVSGDQIKGARFAISAPPECQVSLLSVGTLMPDVVLEGDLSTGITATFDCSTTDSYPFTRDVADVVVYVTGDPPVCCPIYVVPHSASVTGEVEFIKCDDSIEEGFGSQAYVGGDGSGCFDILDAIQPPPTIPTPTDSATGVSLTPSLIFKTPRGYACVDYLYSIWGSLYFGTDPDPPLFCQWGCVYDPGPLEPNTTYYWRVYYYNSNYGDAFSPVWQFTTTGITPTETRTWGHIKALYR